MRRLSRGQPCRGGEYASKQPEVRAGVNVVTEQPKMKSALLVAAGAARQPHRLKRRIAPRTSTFASNHGVCQERAACNLPFQGLARRRRRAGDGRRAERPRRRGEKAGGGGARAHALVRAAGCKGQGSRQVARGVPNIRVSRLSYVVVERRARLPTSSDRGGGGRRRRGRAGPRRAASPAARGAAGPAAPTRPSQSQAAPSSPSRAARHRVRSERLGGPPTDATTAPNERST